MSVLLDSFALMELVSGSPKGQKVKELLDESANLYTTVLNLYEVRYRMTQKTSAEVSAAFIHSLKTSIGIIEINEEISMAASDLKLKNPKMGAVDCHTLAAARLRGLKVVTGDTDFPEAGDVVLL